MVITDILQMDALVVGGHEFHMDDLILSENTDGDVVVTFGGVDDTSVTQLDSGRVSPNEYARLVPVSEICHPIPGAAR